MSPGRPPPPSAKSTTGRRHSLGQLEHAVLLAVVLQPLRAGEHGVVVGHDDAARALVAEQVAVDAADAGDQAVGGRALDQILERAPAALGGDRQRAVLDERARVAEVVDVLARGALARSRAGARPRRGGPRPA